MTQLFIAAFVGDTLFIPDHGSARADCLGGNARTPYRSIQVNIRAGRFDKAEANGVSYLRIPVKWKAA